MAAISRNASGIFSAARLRISQSVTRSFCSPLVRCFAKKAPLLREPPLIIMGALPKQLHDGRGRFAEIGQRRRGFRILNSFSSIKALCYEAKVTSHCPHEAQKLGELRRFHRRTAHSARRGLFESP